MMKRGARNSTSTALHRGRALRSERSVSEKVLWQALRKRQLGFLFKTQVPVGPYHLDFYCPEASLCVEVDGEQHDQSRDARRDAYLKEQGVETIRIPSLDLFDAHGLLAARWLKLIEGRCRERALLHPPAPSSSLRDEEGE
jgi:very-short-patch-repair endonuclease